MVCNTGIGLIPQVDGKLELFALSGLYDGLFLFSDETTGTYWNHMTGEAVYGPLAGKRLALENVLHSTVTPVLAQYPEALVAISEHERVALGEDAAEGGASWRERLLERLKRGLSDQFKGTMREEDDRRPTMEFGIGIWNDSGARYYAMDIVEEQGRVLFDTFDGRRVLIYYDPTAHALTAQYTRAERVWWEGEVLYFSTGERIEDGVRFAEDGSRVEVEHPLQVFTRWYGFSLTFPDTEIYGEG